MTILDADLWRIAHSNPDAGASDAPFANDSDQIPTDFPLQGDMRVTLAVMEVWEDNIIFSWVSLISEGEHLAFATNTNTKDLKRPTSYGPGSIWWNANSAVLRSREIG